MANKTERPATAGAKNTRSKFCSKCPNVCSCKSSTSVEVKRAQSAKRGPFKSLVGTNEDSYVNDSQFSNSKCLFYEICEKDNEINGISQSEIDEARRTGTLKLSRRHFSEIPDVIWSIDMVTDEDRKNIDVRFNKKVEQPWWSYKSLEHLDLSFNCLSVFNPKGTAFYSLTELFINNNSLMEITEEVGKFQKLKLLYLNDNSLTGLPKSLCYLTNLSELCIQRNDIKELPEKLGDLLYLKKLDISYNNIKNIHCDIGYLTSLLQLNMSHNKFELLPEEIQNLRALKILNVSNNCLSSIPNLNDMTHLVEFNGSNNMITKFPNFCNCRKLAEIQLQSNEITELIVDNLQGVPLSKLVLHNNKIVVIPDDIFRISTLVLLDISSNLITKLPCQLALLRNLSNLKLDGNSISDIRQDILRSGTARILAYLNRHIHMIEKCNTASKEDPLTTTELYVNSVEDVCDLNHLTTDMRTTRCLILTDMKLCELSPEILQQAQNEDVFRLDLSKNRFCTIPDGLKVLKQNLTEIIMKGNNLNSIPDFIGEMNNLLYLDVSNNKLNSLPLSMSTCILKALIAECNCFSAIPEVVYSIKPLEHLNFRDNKVVEIDVQNLKNLKHLYTLDLSNNCIERVPPELGHLINIKELHLHGNRFKIPRFDLLNKGTDIVMAYLRDKVAHLDL